MYNSGLFYRRAIDDLRTLELLVANDFEPPNTVCFHSQQYIEKLVKEKMAQKKIPVPKNHNITVLLNILHEDTGVFVPDDITFAAATLESLYLISRYPDDDGETIDLTVEAAEQAYEYAMIIADWLETI